MISIKPIGCNGHCASCYEAKIREAGQYPEFNFEAVKKKLLELLNSTSPNDEVPCLHGGEPLLIPLGQLEELLAVIHQKFGRTSIQTNGLLINDDHIRLFSKYQSSVGISLDGDTEELNYGRLNSRELAPEKRRELTLRVLENIKKLKSANISVSVICVLRKYNARPEKIPELIRFLLRLRDEFRIFSVRLNEIIVFDENGRAEEELTGQELARAWIAAHEIMKTDSRLDWRPPLDFVNKLLGKPAVCILNQCDVWATSAEVCIMGDGSLGCCLHGGAAIDGIQALRMERLGNERYEILRQIPQEEGGCQGCHFWPYCYGGCPGAGIDNDWRSRTRFCEGYKIFFEYILRDPIFRLRSIENNASPSRIGHQDWHGDKPHGDHTD